MAEFTIANLKKTMDKMEADLSAASKYREKFNEAQVELKKVEGEKRLEQKSL